MTYLADTQFVGVITREDGIAENVSALFYAGGLAVSLYALYKGRRVWLASLWAILCLLFLGEETSWFQRFFDYSVPYVEARSTQSEFNLHNLDIFGHGKGRFLDADGNVQFTQKSILSTQNLFRVGFFGYFLVLPLLFQFAQTRNFLRRFGYAPPAWQFLLAAMTVIFVSLVLAFATEPPVRSYIAEMRELIYAAVIFIYTLGFHWRAQDSETDFAPSRLNEGH